MDFKKATELFADPDFDGEPVQIYKPKGDEPIVPPDDEEVVIEPVVEVDIINPQLGERILDPACGTGGFLTCSLEHLRSQVKTVENEQKLQRLIQGTEKKSLPHLLCITNLLLHGVEVPEINHDNT